MTHLTYSLDILWPAFLAGLLVIATHVPLGFEVLRRGIIFIDLAIAQVAGLGVIVAHAFSWEPNGWQVQVIAMASALGAAAVLQFIEKKWPDIQEAVIGSLFVLSASVGIILLADNPHGGEYLKDLLVGQILWVDVSSLVPIAIIYSILLLTWISVTRIRRNFGFYIVFAITVTVSVQLVGVYLVFASLIIPALGVSQVKSNARILFGYAIGVSGYILGLIISAIFDYPTGAVIVISLALVAVLMFMAMRHWAFSKYAEK